MRLEELKSLNREELSLLWFAINKTTPPAIAGIEMEESIFCSLKPHAIHRRVENLKHLVKEEYKHIYDSLRLKLGMESIQISSSVS